MGVMRAAISLTNGQVDADVWLAALAEDGPVEGRPVACRCCPLREGGEWEAGARGALAQLGQAQIEAFGRRWGCHASRRPCAGARRLAGEAA